MPHQGYEFLEGVTVPFTGTFLCPLDKNIALLFFRLSLHSPFFFPLSQKITLWEFPLPNLFLPVLPSPATCPAHTPVHFDPRSPGQLAGGLCGATTCYRWLLIGGGP